MKNTYRVINFHVTNPCNYACRYCFGKFEGEPLPLAHALRIVDGIADYFRDSSVSQGRINLAGGEPLLYPALDGLIEAIHQKGLAVSVITNGSLLTPARIEAWKSKVACVGLSVDALTPAVNRAIGRCRGGETLGLSHWTALAEAYRRCRIPLKINTVVSRLNLAEDLRPLYRACQPQRIKLLRMHLVEGVNDPARPLAVTDGEFRDFCLRHAEFAPRTVREDKGSMEDSYLMVAPDGRVLLNHRGVYQDYGSCLQVPFAAIAARLPLDRAKYAARYGEEVRA
jgi:radical S-adenosyl methionine domain-containing protein 2